MKNIKTPKEYYDKRRTKEEYYENVVLHNRELVKSPDVMRCVCPNDLCDWHGKCHQCVALHRHHNDHVPFCLQPIIKNKLKSFSCGVCKCVLAPVVEMVTDENGVLKEKAGTPIEYRRYVKERDKLK